jgi:cytochrome c biogenesis protein CcdA
VKEFLNSRSVVEVMTLTFTFLIAFVIVLGALIVAVAEILNPETDTTQIVDGLLSVITGILGALLGLLAGKSEAVNMAPKSSPEPPAHEEPI